MAVEALARGDLVAAGRAAERALEADPGDARAREVAARLALANGQPDRAVELLRDDQDPRRVRLRARALFRLGRMEALARDLASVEEQESADGWAAAALPLARAARGQPLYGLSGDPEASLPLVAGLGVPVVEISLGGRPVMALIATSADITVVDEASLPEPGLVEVGLGGLTAGGVPALGRDLSPVGEALGVRLGAVLGLDLLLRLRATLDLPGGALRVRTAPPTHGPEAASLPFVTFDGSFLAVHARLEEGAEAWMTVDTAATFPVALTDAVVEAMGRDLATLPAAPGAPTDDVRLLELARIQLGEVAIEGVPAVTGLVPENLSTLAGAPLGGILGASLFGQVAVSFDPEGRRLVLE